MEVINKMLNKLIEQFIGEDKETICFCGELKDKIDAHSYCRCGAFVPNRRGFEEKEIGRMEAHNELLADLRSRIPELEKMIKEYHEKEI